jgi:hypothetical protein
MHLKCASRLSRHDELHGEGCRRRPLLCQPQGRATRLSRGNFIVKKKGVGKPTSLASHLNVCPVRLISVYLMMWTSLSSKNSSCRRAPWSSRNSFIHRNRMRTEPKCFSEIATFKCLLGRQTDFVANMFAPAIRWAHSALQSGTMANF